MAQRTEAFCTRSSSFRSTSRKIDKFSLAARNNCENVRMFTGIITGVGRIAAVHALGTSEQHGKRVVVATPETYLDDVALGDSIAINGACMTVSAIENDAANFSVDVSAESLAKTSDLDTCGTPVNLEKALRPSDRLGGHIVSGHVDGIGRVTCFAPTGESWDLRILAPQSLARYLAYKGSISVNGVSLTVNHVADRVDGAEVHINLIPHTVQNTALHTLHEGRAVNLEVDTVARYVERMISTGAEVMSDSSARGAR